MNIQCRALPRIELETSCTQEWKVLYRTWILESINKAYNLVTSLFPQLCRPASSFTNPISYHSLIHIQSVTQMIVMHNNLPISSSINALPTNLIFPLTNCILAQRTSKRLRCNPHNFKTCNISPIKGHFLGGATVYASIPDVAPTYAPQDTDGENRKGN
jgi:hypothetical protein